MAIANEAEIVKIIAKVYKALDEQYIEYIKNGSYYYAYQFIQPHSMNDVIAQNLCEEDLNKFVAALSEDEVAVKKLVEANFKLDKFTKTFTEANMKSLSNGVLQAYSSVRARKRQDENVAKKQKENRELYKAARLTPRQKEVLASLGMPISAYETVK